MMKSNSDIRFWVSVLLVFAAVLSRTLFHIAPNIEFVTAIGLLSARYLGRQRAFAITFFTMAISDVIIGNSSIFIFTWSAYLFSVLALPAIINRIRDGKPSRYLVYASCGVMSSFWFYLWTNFGVWALDSWGMYPKTLGGLFNSYAMGIPFLKVNLLSNIILVPLVFFLAEKVLSIKVGLRGQLTGKRT